MQVTTEQIDPCKVALTISVEPEKVTAAKEKAFSQISRNIQIPGFRKGKVPANLARNYVDPGRVNQRAVEMLLEPAYAEAIAESTIEPFGQPEIELVDMTDDGPFVFKAFVPLRPVVTLGPYKGLAIERRLLQVGDADVERQIEALRTRAAEYPEITDRTVQLGDVILADVAAAVEGDENEATEPTSTVIEVGKNIADFDNGVVGMAAGETREIDALYPEDFADEILRGKRTHFTITVKEIRAKVLPELNDEFAAKAHPTAKTVEELTTEIRTSLENAANEMADNDLEARLISEIVQNSSIHFPDFLLRAEMEEDFKNLQERLERDRATLDDYLEATGRTKEDLEAQFAQQAARRIQNSLVLSEVARTEDINITEEDVEAKLQERADSAKVSAAAVRAYAEKNGMLENFRNQALTEKILTFLKDSSTITEKAVTEEELKALNVAEGVEDDELDEEDDEFTETSEIPTLTDQLPSVPRRRKKTEATETTAETPEAEAAD